MTVLTLVSDDSVTTDVGEIVYAAVTVDDDTVPVFRTSEGRRLAGSRDEIGIWTARWATERGGSFAISVTAGAASPVMMIVTVEDGAPDPPTPGDSFVDDAVTALLADPDSDAAKGLKASFAPALTVKVGPTWRAAALAAPPDEDIPTITVSTVNSLSGGVAITATPDFFGDPHFRYDGCPDVIAGSGTVTPPLPEGGGSHRVEPVFVTAPDNDHVVIGVKMNAAGEEIGLRLEIDGQPFQGAMVLDWHDTTPSTTQYVNVPFPVAKARTIKFTGENLSGFIGVWVPTGQTVSRPLGEITVLGADLDSYGAGANGHSTGDPATSGCAKTETAVYTFAKLLGFDSVINSSDGGTGPISDSGGTKAPFGDRIPALLEAHVDALITGTSINDASEDATGPEVYTALAAILTQTIDVPEVFVTSTSKTGDYAAFDQAGQQVAKAFGRQWIDVHGFITADRMNAADLTHPSLEAAQDLGYEMYSRVDRSRADTLMLTAKAGRVSTDLALVTDPASATYDGDTVTLTATQSVERAGSAAFYDNGVLLDVEPVTAGEAVITTSALDVGEHRLLSRFLPADPRLVRPSTSNPVLLSISDNLGFVDTFNRADGAPGSTENGKAYTTSGGGAFAISSNKLVNATVPSGTAMITADAETPDGEFSFTLGGTVTGVRALLRHSSSTNFLAVVVVSSQIVIQETVAGVNGGAATTLFTGSGGGWASGDVITIVLAGTTITVKKNGVAVTGLNGVTITRFPTNTRFGIGIGSSGAAATIDNLEFAAA